MKKYIPEITIFLSGALIMILELLASRILAPYVGSSNIIWTSIIGIILISMSLGYYYGGKIANENATYNTLSSILTLSAILISFIPLLETTLVKKLSELLPKSHGITSITSTIILFGFSSFLLAMISPYIIKLKNISKNEIAFQTGRLSALSTLGSITGTFLAGFFLIPTFGNKTILLGIIILLLLLAVLLRQNKKIKYYLIIIALTIFTITNMLLAKTIFKNSNPDIISDIDSEYSRLWVKNIQLANGKQYKTLQVATSIESYIDSQTNEMGAKYLYFYNLFEHFNPTAQNTLIIGGAAYTYPTHYINKFPTKNIDVVEIDPKMTETAKQYFNLKENERMNIYHQDGRTFLNTTTKKYDAIFIDAYHGGSVPFQLTTVETLEKAKSALNKDGLVLANVVSTLESDAYTFLEYQYTTFKKVFPKVMAFAVSTKDDPQELQNIILVGIKTDKEINLTSKNSEYESYLQNIILNIKETPKPLTDDYAPVENFDITIN